MKARLLPPDSNGNGVFLDRPRFVDRRPLFPDRVVATTLPNATPRSPELPPLEMTFGSWVPLYRTALNCTRRLRSRSRTRSFGRPEQIVRGPLPHARPLRGPNISGRRKSASTPCSSSTGEWITPAVDCQTKRRARRKSKGATLSPSRAGFVPSRAASPLAAAALTRTHHASCSLQTRVEHLRVMLRLRTGFA